MDRPRPTDVSATKLQRSHRRRHAAASMLQTGRLPTLIAPDVDAETLLRSTLDALSAHIAVLDESGTIIAVNQAWRTFAHASGFVDETHGVGMNYLARSEERRVGK